jgi:3-hydroxyisobutyrate dehydrogenase
MAAIGFIGLGNMGAPMAANLVKSGEHVLGFDLVPALCEASASDGVQIVASARSTVEDADVVITMLPAGEHVVSVWNDIVPRARQGTLFIDCSTIDVAGARRAHALAAARGIGALDAAVSAAPRRRRSPSWSAAPITPLRAASRSWSVWASASCIAAKPATARSPRSATT